MMPSANGWPRGPANELHHAALFGITQRVRALLCRGSIDIDQGCPKGWTPLVWATAEGHSSIVETLLSHGANTSIAADKGITPLYLATETEHLAATEKLVTAGADLEAADVEGRTPLHWAAQLLSPTICRVLVKAGVKLEAPNFQGFTPLHGAAAEGYPEPTQALIDAGANVDTRLPRTEQTPLYTSAWNGHADVVRVLLRANASPWLPRTEDRRGDCGAAWACMWV